MLGTIARNPFEPATAIILGSYVYIENTGNILSDIILFVATAFLCYLLVFSICRHFEEMNDISKLNPNITNSGARDGD